jgi:type IX secretion system PorP/SprF family membrane protein
MKKNYSFLIIIFTMLDILACSRLSGQDVAFSQFYASPVYLNPAMAGSSGCSRIVANYRNQWPQMNQGYKTYGISYDRQIEKISGGIGITVLSDNAGGGLVNTTSAGLMYAYRANLSRTISLSAAMQASIMQKKISWDKLAFGDMIDQRYGIIYQTKEKRPAETRNFLDFCAGVFAYSRSMYGGFSINHLTRPDEAFIAEGTSRLPLKVTVHAGGIIELDKKPATFNGEEDATTLSPNILIQKQGQFNQFNIGSYFQKSVFVCGLWYRGNIKNHKVSSDSFILLAGIQKGIFKFGYSYDMTISKLSNETGGAHEISAGIQIPDPAARKKRFKAVHCPVF